MNDEFKTVDADRGLASVGRKSHGERQALVTCVGSEGAKQTKCDMEVEKLKVSRLEC